MRPAIGIALAVALQTAALVAMIGVKQWTLATGTPVLLEIVPIDPRSLFRGDYVDLSYAIGRLELDALGGDDDFAEGDTIHVLLREGETYWEPVSAHRERPTVPSGQVAIEGEVVADRSPAGAGIFVRYGIETYFIPEGEGRELERPGDDRTVSILAAVDRYGGAGIKAVFVNGEARYTETLF